ncbi:ribosomal protein S6 kinase beta [Pancytospora philotis]|nr:ribosomal protein S6 kinase beta [Pancytospora philotis]
MASAALAAMIEKSRVRCVKTINTGPFFKCFLVYLDYASCPEQLYQLRAMSKKLIVTNKADEDMVLHELYIRSHVRHPFLANQICAFQDYDNLFYVSEHAPVHLLKSEQLPRLFDMRAIRFYAAEMMLCLRYLHSKSLVYTYLSPDNIMLDERGHIKLGYAFCNSLNGSEYEVLENIEYASLEYLVRGDFSIAGDYWSLGIVLYRMAFGYTPFGSESFDETLKAMQGMEIEFPDYADRAFRDLVSRLLNLAREPGWLSSAADAGVLFAHPFFDGIDWDKLERREVEPPYAVKVSQSAALRSTAPSLSTLYTSDFIVGDKDGYGQTFQNYSTVTFLKNEGSARNAHA